jgi:VWA domain containing CoxE-like protein
MTLLLQPRVSDTERARRWRLVLGGGEADGTATRLDRDDSRIDAALGALYDRGEERGRGGAVRGRRVGGLGRSAPAVSRWLGDIRRYFPVPVVQVLQRDAVERLDLTHLLLEPELLAELEPDVHLVSVLVELNRLLPEATKDTARQVIGGVLETLRQRFADRTRAAVTGALARAARSHRPRPADIDWGRTIRANLRHWLPEQRTVVPERLIGYGRHSPSLARDVVIALDQSGSMADSVVHASLFACLLARMPALRTSLVAFDTSAVDLTDALDDPVDVLFGVQVGGGTDIGNALGACQRLITRPSETLLILVSDLFEGGDVEVMRNRVGVLVRSGVTLLVLLALSDDGAPVANHHEAAALAALGAHVATCTPDRFPDVLGAALEGQPLPVDVAVATGRSDR